METLVSSVKEVQVQNHEMIPLLTCKETETESTFNPINDNDNLLMALDLIESEILPYLTESKEESLNNSSIQNQDSNNQASLKNGRINSLPISIEIINEKGQSNDTTFICEKNDDNSTAVDTTFLSLVIDTIDQDSLLNSSTITKEENNVGGNSLTLPISICSIPTFNEASNDIKEIKENLKEVEARETRENIKETEIEIEKELITNEMEIETEMEINTFPIADNSNQIIENSSSSPIQTIHSPPIENDQIDIKNEKNENHIELENQYRLIFENLTKETGKPIDQVFLTLFQCNEMTIEAKELLFNRQSNIKTWTHQEDVIIITENSKIHEIIEKRGLEATNERRNYLLSI